MRKSFCLLGVLALAGTAFGYTTQYTQNFNAASPAGWSDPFNSGTTLVAGDSTPTDSPAYSPLPQSAPGYNSTAWLRLGTTNTGAAGVTLALWDGTGGGGGTSGTDYTVEGDVFIVIDATNRHQQGLAGRATGTDNLPFEFFYANGTPSQPNGYGYRSGGSTANYGLFPAETSNRWVHMKMTFHGSQVDVAVDRDLNGTYDYTQTNIALTATSGKAGFFSVLNNGSGGAAITTQYAYFDNFKYTPAGSGVNDWSIY